jgi:hypothetical protein
MEMAGHEKLLLLIAWQTEASLTYFANVSAKLLISLLSDMILSDSDGFADWA